MKILFDNITVITMMGEIGFLRGAFVATDGEKISYVGTERPQGNFDRVVRGEHRLLMPGLINAHSHLGMVAMRGYADDMTLQDWLFNEIFPVEDKFDQQIAEITTRLAISECIAGGVTSVNDMYLFMDTAASAYADSGMKANIAKSIKSVELMRGSEKIETSLYDFAKHWHGACNGRIKADAMIHAEYTTSPEQWESTAAAAKELGLVTHVHISETKREHEEGIARRGATPARALYEHHVFDGRVSAAHCVYLSSDDAEILRASSATVLHCPISNLKLASGIAPINTYLENGMRVAIGTDGASSNNSLDMFAETKLAAILQKGTTGIPTVVPALTALAMATKNGAYSQGRENECGVIAEGFDADMVMLDTDSPRLFPCHNPVSTAVYSATPADVCMTMTRGEILYENREWKTIDIEKTRYEMENIVLPKLFK